MRSWLQCDIYYGSNVMMAPIGRRYRACASGSPSAAAAWALQERRWEPDASCHYESRSIARDADAACPISTGGGTRRVRLVRGVGRGVSDQYGGQGGAGARSEAPRPEPCKDSKRDPLSAVHRPAQPDALDDA